MKSCQEWAVYIGLAITGVIYNFIIGRLSKKSYFKYIGIPVLSLLPVLAALLGASYLMGWGGFPILVSAFAAVGAPLVLGAYFRGVKRRDNEEKEMFRELREDLKWPRN